MEVHHKTGPVHGWRELLKEIGIIVLGVSIALGAEQLVEFLHWRHEVAAERKAMLSDAYDSLGGPTLRIRQQPCVDRRLAEVRTVLERHRKGHPLGVIGPVAAPPRLGATRGSWEIALAGQALSHMPLKEKLDMSNAFGDFDLWDRSTLEEAEVWRRLAVLEDAELMADQDWSRATQAYAEARVINERLRLLAPFVVKQGSLGQKIDQNPMVAGFENFAQQICKPMIAR